MIIAIHQPQYLPWLGYIQKIARANTFVFLDDVQFKKNEWQNRNKIKIASGWQWITVPVIHKFPQEIREVKINNSVDWQRQHLNALIINYGKAAHFSSYIGFFKRLYSKKWIYLSELNIYVIKNIIRMLGIKTKLISSSGLKVGGKKTERLINISKALKAKYYLCGEGARGYLEMDKFREKKIEVIFQDFEHPIYNQLYCTNGQFLENLSVVDLLFNHGKESLNILMRSK